MLGQVIRGNKPEPPKESQIAPVLGVHTAMLVGHASHPSVEGVVAFVAPEGVLSLSLSTSFYCGHDS